MKYFHASFFLRQTRFSNFSLKQNKLISEIFLISPPPEQRAREFGKWWSDVLYFSIKFPHNRLLLAISLLLACFQMKNIRSEAAINFHPLWEALWKPLRGPIKECWCEWRGELFVSRSSSAQKLPTSFRCTASRRVWVPSRNLNL